MMQEMIFSVPRSLNTQTEESIHHIDACILAYLIYNQTLFYKVDPFFDKLTGQYRQLLMTKLKNDTLTIGQQPPHLDCMAYFYDHIDPKHLSLIGLGQSGYLTILPPEWRDKIGQVYYVCSNNEQIEWVQCQHYGIKPIQLYCFEGETGHNFRYFNRGKRSIMGYVAHDTEQQRLMVVFRGSQSGQHFISNLINGSLWGTGHPDWVTNLNSRTLMTSPLLSKTGRVAKGFGHTQLSCLPTLDAILKYILFSEAGLELNQITITGHSLGGALAALFVSALQNGLYGENLIQSAANENNALAEHIGTLIKNLTCYTFAAPPVGDWRFIHSLGNAVHQYFINSDPITFTSSLSFYAIRFAGQPHATTRIKFGLLGSLKSLLDPESHFPDIMRIHIMAYHALSTQKNTRIFSQHLSRTWFPSNNFQQLTERSPGIHRFVIKNFNLDYLIYIFSTLVDVYLRNFHHYKRDTALQWLTLGLYVNHASQFQRYQSQLLQTNELLAPHIHTLDRHDILFTSPRHPLIENIINQVQCDDCIITIGFIQQEFLHLKAQLPPAEDRNSGKLASMDSSEQLNVLFQEIRYLKNNLQGYLQHSPNAQEIIRYVFEIARDMCSALDMELNELEKERDIEAQTTQHHRFFQQRNTSIRFNPIDTTLEESAALVGYH